MKARLPLLAILTMLNLCCYSQVAFENGYFINNDDQKIDCLIENLDWRNNPTEFKYRLHGSVENKKTTISEVKEFGVLNLSKYVRAKVKIDRSADALVSQDPNRNPVFNEEQLFLKVLLEGKASLYLYEDKGLTRFFFKTDSKINQLIYKEFLTEQRTIGTNDFFRQQLFTELKCSDVTLRDLKLINYTQAHLEKIFVKYNMCTNSPYIDFENRKNKKFFSLAIRPGVNLSGLSISNSNSTDRSMSFKNSVNFRVGLEGEFILPFNNSKWAVILEPTYQSFESSKTTPASNLSGGELVTTVDYSSIELPIGFRHYFFLSKDSKIFLNVAGVLDFSLDSSIKFARADGSELSTLDIKTRPNIAIGVGYKQNNRYSVEIRYLTNRVVLSDYIYWESAYKTLSLVVGYSF